MAPDAIMPKLGESITEGTILEWKKNIGDSITRAETILEISTDKVDSEVPSPASGTLIEILYQKNDVVPVGEVIARIGESGEEIPDKIEEKNLDMIEEENSIIEQEAERSITNEADNTPLIKSKRGKFYSPLVKSIIKKEGLSIEELDMIDGSGTNGRVNKNDVLSYLKSRKTTQEVPSVSTSSYELKNRIEPMDLSLIHI